MLDSHHHLWNFTSPEFDWLESDLKKSFLAPELEQTIPPADVTGTVAVQARCSLAENEFLVVQATHTDLIKGIVGWADLTDPDIDETLHNLAKHSLIKGIREITQGTPDEKFLTNPAFNQGVAKLTDHNLTYDLLIFQEQLETADHFVKQHPNLPMVLDHCAKPQIRKNNFPHQWAEGIERIAQNPNLHVKLSGLATEIRDNSPCTPELLEPYVQTILQAFTPDRIMFGSDWPVSLSAASYQHYLKTTKSLLSHLTQDEQQKIFSTNTARFYSL